MPKHNIPADKLALYDTHGNQSEDQTEGYGQSLHFAEWPHVYLPESIRFIGSQLPEDARENFLKKYKTTLFEAYGHVMKEYVTVPDRLLRNMNELRWYLDL